MKGNGCLLTCDKASLSDILRVHDYNYLHKILQQTKKTPNEQTLSADGTQRFDRDTVLSQHTWDVALLSAGAVLQAVDEIMSGTYTNAFCAVRPPGHHSGVYGKTNHYGVEKLCNREHLTNGFCFINNVAVAAGYAKYRYREKVKRIAIVDMDVHHGNGTQEIVECLRPKTFGATTETPFSTLTQTQLQYRPWLDQDDAANVLYCSVHLFSEDRTSFFPGTGALSGKICINLIIL